LILQHPQEARNPLGTARLLAQAAPGSVHKVGLSWRSLGAALGREAVPSEWAVLFLGALKESSKLDPEVPFRVVERTGKNVIAPRRVKGIVLLDGNWKQSKTLWWRNPWLVRLNRIMLNPQMPSRWGGLRRQPRKNALSTIEAAAETLRGLNEAPEIPEALLNLFDKHVDKITPVRH
jgi:DTW domain-containing protein YfiP